MSDATAPVTPGYRRCPACGEEIRQEAVICRFCRYDLRTGTFIPLPTSGPPSRAASAPARTNSLAVASLVLGIVNMLVGSILALVVGYRATREIDGSNG